MTHHRRNSITELIQANTYQCCNLEFGVSTSSYEDWLARTNRPGPTYGSWEKQHKLGGGVSNSVSQIPTLIQQSYLCRLLTICRAVGDRGRWEFVPSDFGRNRSKTLCIKRLWIQTCTRPDSFVMSYVFVNLTCIHLTIFFWRRKIQLASF